MTNAEDTTASGTEEESFGGVEMGMGCDADLEMVRSCVCWCWRLAFGLLGK